VRTEIHELHQRLHFTAVYVTHDQSEALALGDRLAIMRAGKIEQLGRPEEVFEEPATEYVAGFIGMENRLSLERTDGGWAHVGEPLKGELGFDDRSLNALAARTRPEDLQLARPGTPLPPDMLAFTALVADSEFGGRWMDVLLTAGGTRLHSRMPAGERGSWIRSLNAGEQVTAYLRNGDTIFFDTAGVRIPTTHADRNPTSVVGV
jgi:iron(III) transport system ATP-binding protein